MRVLLIAYDNESYIHWFPQGLAYIAAALRKRGDEVTIYQQDVYHWPDEHLTDYLDRNVFDVVGVGVIGGYYQYRKLLKIAAAINRSRHRPFFMMGGHGPSPEPEYFLRRTEADVAIIGEGEVTVVELMDAVEQKKSLHGVNGIAFFDAGKFVKTPERALVQNVDDIDFPAYDLFPIDYYALIRFARMKPTDRCLPMLSGRGCTFKCNFCYRMDKGHRARAPEAVLEEVALLQKNYAINYVYFSDELLMVSEQGTVEFCQAILKSGQKFNWSCNGRLNYAKPDVLKLMSDAGCVFINYGIESLDQKVLNTMKKGLSVKMIHEGIENTLASEISPGFNIIFGNIGETKESLAKGVEFLLKYDDHSQLRNIRPVTPYPGSPLYDYAIKKGLLKDVEDFYECKHVNSDLLAVNFTDLTDDEFYDALYDANLALLSRYFVDQEAKAKQMAYDLYKKRDASLRGFRQT